jgi:hypothetical protein
MRPGEVGPGLSAAFGRMPTARVLPMFRVVGLEKLSDSSGSTDRAR